MLQLILSFIGTSALVRFISTKFNFNDSAAKFLLERLILCYFREISSKDESKNAFGQKIISQLKRNYKLVKDTSNDFLGEFHLCSKHMIPKVLKIYLKTKQLKKC